jgi:hypothetical protein
MTKCIVLGESQSLTHRDKIENEFVTWCKSQEFPWSYQHCLPELKKKVTLDGVKYKLKARPMSAWKMDDYKVIKGEKALFWLGNMPWWSKRQVEYIRGFRGWRPQTKGVRCDFSPESDDFDREMGEAMGGPFF